jgi:hypothetical protein
MVRNSMGCWGEFISSINSKTLPGMVSFRLPLGEFRELFSYWMMSLIDLPTNDLPVASEVLSTLVVPVFGMPVWKGR